MFSPLLLMLLCSKRKRYNYNLLLYKANTSDAVNALL